MLKKILKKIFVFMGINLNGFKESIGKKSVRMALKENRLSGMLGKLRAVVPDISNQEESSKEGFNDYWELKRRGLHAFQCSLMLEALNNITAEEICVVDIGDSAGTHMLYLKALTSGRFKVDTISVNLDSRAIAKIKDRGLKAVQCRAEDLKIEEKNIDLFTSFQMVEHLHNPAIFFYRLLKRNDCKKILITVPYRRASRVGIYRARNDWRKKTYAEDEHIFELNPQDWSLLMLHSGWRVVADRIYYQYPKKIPVLSQLLAYYWRKTDFEGFWGATLERDVTYSQLYQDWEE